jgi:hypothetical protein
MARRSFATDEDPNIFMEDLTTTTRSLSQDSLCVVEILT